MDSALPGLKQWQRASVPKPPGGLATQPPGSFCSSGYRSLQRSLNLPGGRVCVPFGGVSAAQLVGAASSGRSHAAEEGPLHSLRGSGLGADSSALGQDLHQRWRFQTDESEEEEEEEEWWRRSPYPPLCLDEQLRCPRTWQSWRAAQLASSARSPEPRVYLYRKLGRRTSYFPSGWHFKPQVMALTLSEPGGGQRRDPPGESEATTSLLPRMGIRWRGAHLVAASACCFLCTHLPSHLLLPAPQLLEVSFLTAQARLLTTPENCFYSNTSGAC